MFAKQRLSAWSGLNKDCPIIRTFANSKKAWCIWVFKLTDVDVEGGLIQFSELFLRAQRFQTLILLVLKNFLVSNWQRGLFKGKEI